MGATTDGDYCPNCGSTSCSASCYYSSSDEPEEPKNAHLEKGSDIIAVVFFVLIPIGIVLLILLKMLKVI